MPITIDGSFDIMPRTRDFHFAHYAPLRLTIHAPIHPTTQGSENVKRLLEESYQTIMDGLPETRRGYVKNDDQ